MSRRKRRGSSDRHGDGVGVTMKDLDTSGHRGSDSVRYRLGGIGNKECQSRPGRFKDYYPSKKFEWENLMAGRRNRDEYSSSPRRDMIADHQAQRFRAFRGREDVFQENMSFQEERESRLLHSCRDSGKAVSPQLEDRRFNLPTKNGNAGLWGIGNMQTKGQPDEEGSSSGGYLHEEDRHAIYSDKGPCYLMPSPSQYGFSRPPSFGNLSEERVKHPAGKVETGKCFLEDIDPMFESAYVPLDMSSPYQPQPRTASPLCISKPSEYREPLLMKEKSTEGKIKSLRRFVGDGGAAISSDNALSYGISPPPLSRSNAGTPLSTGNVSVSEDGEYVLTASSPATKIISKRKYLHEDDGPRVYSDYGHCYTTPSPHSKSKTLTSQSMVWSSPDREQGLMVKQAVAQRTEREKYFSEEDTPRFFSDGFCHEMPSPSELEPKTLTPMSVSHAIDPVVKSYPKHFPKSRQCLKNGIPLLPSYTLGPNTEISQESSPRSIKVHLNGKAEDACALRCGKGVNCKDQNCIYVEEDVRNHCNSTSHALYGKMPNTLEEYSPGDRLWVNVMNGVNACGHSHEYKSKGSMLPTQHQCSQDHEFLLHPHDSISSRHQYQDLEALNENMLPHEVKKRVHCHEKRENKTYEVQRDKFARLDDDHASYFMDDDLYIDKRHIKVPNPGYFHDTSYNDSILHGHARGPFSGKYGRDDSFPVNKPYHNHQEDEYGQLGGRDDEPEHLSNQDMQCQMLMRRSAHIQNNDFTGVGDEALDSTIDSDYQLPFQNLPLRMQKRLGKQNNYSDRDIKKRLKPCPQINDFHMSKKHKSSSSLAEIQDISEHHQGHGFDLSSTKVISGMADLDEDSQKFKEHVHRAFLESVKRLFESSARQRKYLGLDKYESLSCGICGREAEDTHSLAKHAFACVKMDMRAQHLGLHKALCVLMGWNSLVSPNNPISHLVLPKSEHLAVKEDLMIWPPVVVVHNSSIRNKDLRKQKIISISKVESLLEGVGFVGKNYKVHIGNDQSVMVVRFNATLSGLQAAEELHNYYAKNKHGRIELQQITPNDGCDSREESQNAILTAEDVLYGYLGIVEDLPKLHSQVKKGSLIKSIKELLAVNAP